MDPLEINEQFIITDEDALRALYKPQHDIALKKCQSRLDKHSKAFIARSPFICIGTQDMDGNADVSPRGDPSGFVHVLDDTTLAIPDRPGNNRLDSLVNVVSNPNIGLLFIIPGFDDTLRINGTARLTNDPHILERMSVNERTPSIAILVTLKEIYMHCAKAFRRSHLWDPEYFQDRSSMPSLSKIVLDQTTGAPEDDAEMQKIDADLEIEYKNTMY